MERGLRKYLLLGNELERKILLSHGGFETRGEVGGVAVQVNLPYERRLAADPEDSEFFRQNQDTSVYDLMSLL